MAEQPVGLADPSAPVELIIFAEEEGPTFGLGMLGSRAWVGEISPDQLSKLSNRNGHSYLEAGTPHGVDARHFARDRINPAHYRGLIEVHIEQGPSMWKNRTASERAFSMSMRLA